jgi:AcrR family transcriptional regulator
MGRRARRKLEVHATLRAVALRHFEERGFEATTVRDIAGEAGVSERTFYRYFETKEDVLLDEARSYLAAVEAFLERRPAGESPMAGLLALTDGLTHEWAIDDDLLRVIQLITANASAGGRFHGLLQDHVDRLTRLFAARTGASPDDVRSRVAAASGAAVLLQAVLQFVSSDGTRSVSEIGRAMLLVAAGGLDPELAARSSAPA